MNGLPAFLKPYDPKCMGHPDGHRWDWDTHNPTGIVCTKCGMRGLDR